MIAADHDTTAVEYIRKVLARAIGQQNAVTIEHLVSVSGLPNRRAGEQMLELHLQDFGFAVCAGSSGYFRPATADELNHYVRSLQSRIRCLAIRIRTVRKSAAAEGWPRHGKDFIHKDLQGQLFN